MPKIGKPQIILIVVGIFLLILGIVLHTTSSREMEIEIDYTNIKSCNYDAFRENLTCPEFIIAAPSWTYCVCNMKFELPYDFEAPVDLYYELPSFDQGSIAASRDNKQLSGELSLTPSDSCGNYTYAEVGNVTKPIAPCGAMADAYFNDSYIITFNDTELELTTGVISDEDKKMYHNPPGDNFTAEFENFTKPINWGESQWETFINKYFNAFENERFIGWMTESWKRKPYARFNESLHKGTYQLQVFYYYPPTRYSGTRKLYLTSASINIHSYRAGIAFIVIGSIVLACGLASILWLFIQERKQKKNNRAPALERPLRS